MTNSNDLKSVYLRRTSAYSLALVFAAALIVIVPNSAGAQAATGPLVPAIPSDQPVASPPVSVQSSADRVGGKPNLAGTWKENKDQSDDPRQKMRQAAQDSGIAGQDPNQSPNAGADQSGPRGGWGGGGGGFGGPGGQPGSGYPGGPGGGGWGGPGGQAGQNGGPEADHGQNGGPYGQGPNGNGPSGRRGDEFAQITIEQTPALAKVMNASGRLVASYSSPDQQASNSSPDANTSSSDTNSSRRRNRNAPAVTQWQGDQFVATSQMGGGTTTRTYELSPNGRQLYVTTKIENSRFKEPIVYRTVYDPATVSNDGKNQ